MSVLNDLCYYGRVRGEKLGLVSHSRNKPGTDGKIEETCIAGVERCLVGNNFIGSSCMAVSLR